MALLEPALLEPALLEPAQQLLEPERQPERCQPAPPLRTEQPLEKRVGGEPQVLTVL
jgi:hypothetical protein